MKEAITQLTGLFQSTLPVRGATQADKAMSFNRDISIHAPRKGSDLLFHREPVTLAISIHAPRKGSDDEEVLQASIASISIHAPRKGSDPVFANIGEQAIKFQSTLPVRGATSSLALQSPQSNDFNPRSP